MDYNVNFNVLFKLIKMHFLVSDLYSFSVFVVVNEKIIFELLDISEDTLRQSLFLLS